MAKPDFKKKDKEKKPKDKKEVDETKLLSALESLNANDDDALAALGRSLVEAVSDFSVAGGTVVAAINDPTYPFEGVKGKVKGPSAKGSGFVDVEYPNGVVVPMQSSLLIPV